MPPKSNPTKPDNKKYLPSEINDDLSTNSDLVAEHISSQARSGDQAPRNTKSYVWRAPGWMLALSLFFIFVGLIIQDINQPLDTIRWLIYRRGYPYFQALSFSILIVISGIVLRNFIQDLAKIDKVPWHIGIILKILPNIFPEQKSNKVWKLLLFCSFITVIFSISFPKCLNSASTLTSFDIYENGEWIAHISPGETKLLSAGSYIDIEAKLEANLFNLASPQMNCDWATYTGDGKLLATTNCKINYQTGVDGKPDPVYVTMTQKGCSSSFANEYFFITNP